MPYFSPQIFLFYYNNTDNTVEFANFVAIIFMSNKTSRTNLFFTIILMRIVSKPRNCYKNATRLMKKEAEPPGPLGTAFLVARLYCIGNPFMHLSWCYKFQDFIGHSVCSAAQWSRIAPDSPVFTGLGYYTAPSNSLTLCIWVTQTDFIEQYWTQKTPVPSLTS